MSEVKVLDGSMAMAEAVKQSHVDVVVSSPIIPSISVLEAIFFDFSNEQEMEILNVESARSAISACVGAAVAGGRVFSATASQSLAAMHEILLIASSLRLPVILGIANRALAAPVNLYADHSAVLMERDCGWVQIFSKNPQEAYDNLIQAFRVAEHPNVRLPAMVMIDSFETSHFSDQVSVPGDEEIDDFLGKMRLTHSLLDIDKAKSIGFTTDNDYYFEHKFNQRQGMENARQIIRDVGKEFGDRFGRYYDFFESYQLEDAEQVIVVMGAVSVMVRECVEEMRKKNEKVGLIRIRVYRPFPGDEIREALAHVKAVAVLDRFLGQGTAGSPLYNDICSALYSLENRPGIMPCVYGLGGRALTPADVDRVFSELEHVVMKGIKNSDSFYIGLRD